MNNTDEMEIDLLKLIKALWKRALVIILVALIFAAACTVRSSSPSGSTMRFLFSLALSQTRSITPMAFPPPYQKVTPSKPCHTFFPLYIMALA